jgi:type IV pilus assembly protein PilV
MIFPIVRNAGFSLLEVLVALFLITVALLGTAGMQAYGVKVTQGGQFRAQAVLLGTDLMERVEANNVAAVAGNYVATLPAPPITFDCVTTPCLPARMAAYDLDQFQQNLARQLPAATATITITGAGPFVYTLTINWQERSFKSKSSATASAATTESFSFTVTRTVYNRAEIV